MCEWDDLHDPGATQKFIFKIREMSEPGSTLRPLYQLERSLTYKEYPYAATTLDKEHASLRNKSVLLLHDSPSDGAIAFHIHSDLIVVDTLPKPGWIPHSNEFRFYPRSDGSIKERSVLCIRLKTRDTGYCMTLI